MILCYRRKKSETWCAMRMLWWAFIQLVDWQREVQQVGIHTVGMCPWGLLSHQCVDWWIAGSSTDADKTSTTSPPGYLTVRGGQFQWATSLSGLPPVLAVLMEVAVALCPHTHTLIQLTTQRNTDRTRCLCQHPQKWASCSHRHEQPSTASFSSPADNIEGFRRDRHTCCRSLQDLVWDPWCIQELHPDLLSPGSWPPDLGALQVPLTFVTHIHTHQPRREGASIKKRVRKRI